MVVQSYTGTRIVSTSVEEALKAQNKPYPLDKEQTIELYDSISKDVNSTFPSFLHGRFNVGLERGAYIRAERENLSDYSLLLKRSGTLCAYMTLMVAVWMLVVRKAK